MYYKMASVSNDWAACAALMRAQGQPPQELTSPTIMAFDDEKLRGFIATTPDPGMVLGGPVVMTPGGDAPFIIARLATLYQKVLISMGIERITFYAHENDSPFGRAMKRMFPQITPYAKKGQVMFYHWPLDPKLQRSA